MTASPDVQLGDTVQGVLATKVVIQAGSKIVDQVGNQRDGLKNKVGKIEWKDRRQDKTSSPSLKGAMHKALVLVLTQDTKKGMVPDNAGGELTACQIYILIALLFKDDSPQML